MSVISRTGTPLFEGLPRHTTVVVGTTPIKLDIRRCSGAGAVLVKLVNLHATQNIAWTLTPIDAAAPTITALGATTDGSIVQPGPEYWGLNTTGRDVWVVASAAATPLNVTDFVYEP